MTESCQIFFTVSRHRSCIFSRWNRVKNLATKCCVCCLIVCCLVQTCFVWTISSLCVSTQVVYSLHLEFLLIARPFFPPWDDVQSADWCCWLIIIYLNSEVEEEDTWCCLVQLVTDHSRVWNQHFDTVLRFHASVAGFHDFPVPRLTVCWLTFHSANFRFLQFSSLSHLTSNTSRKVMLEKIFLSNY